MKVFKLLLSSRKVWTAFAALVAAIAAEGGWLPGVPEEKVTEVVVLIGTLASSIILGIAHEDHGAAVVEVRDEKPAIEDVHR